MKTLDHLNKEHRLDTDAFYTQMVQAREREEIALQANEDANRTIMELTKANKAANREIARLTKALGIF